MVSVYDQTQGYLVDLDFAIRLQTPQMEGKTKDPRTQHFTMSTPFLAIDLLSAMPPPHCHRHVIEAFFWTLLWTVIDYDEGGRNDSIVLDDWHNGTWLQIKETKNGVLVEPLPLLEHITEPWSSLRAILLRMIQLFFEAKRMMTWTTDSDAETAGGVIHYESFMAVLDSALLDTF